MRIAEIYASLQGEGLLAGTPSAFVRTSGCNLRCHWCDTPFTSWEPVGDQRSVGEILDAVAALDRDHVVITGGEPLLFPEVSELCQRLRHRGCHVTIETAGTVWLDTDADLMSISPKLASSGPPAGTAGGWATRHESVRRRDEVLLAFLRRGDRVLFMPQGRRPEELAGTAAWLAEECRRLGVQLAHRYHIEWFGHTRGT
jgi:7-carboxy-7-deazaguanine synthase